MTTKSIRKFTCVLIGDDGQTKNAFEEQLVKGGFPMVEMNEQGLEVRPLVFQTTAGSLLFRVLDATGQQKFKKLSQDQDRVLADCTVIMFENAESDHGALLKKYKDIPTILCGVKKQIKDITKKTKLQYFYNINSQNTNNYEYLFLWLGGQLLGDMQLELLSMIGDELVDKPPMEGD
ncbi:hypothetical protein KR059_009445 [Drosophila kikkawai]|nr:hypothetical protein KR059_009445 [Drosophila kikkawai]